MLKLSLLTDEYIIINHNIVIQLSRVAGGRAYLAVDASKEIPIVRGAVLEREGGQRPACLTKPIKRSRKYHRDHIFSWNDDRERAVRVMHEVMDHLERNGSGTEAAILRKELDRIIPPLWESEVGAPPQTPPGALPLDPARD